MSQTDCMCHEDSLEIPLTGISLKMLKSAFPANEPGDAGIDYSLEEQWTGKLWINGKKIYQKTIVYEGPLSSNILVPHGIENLDHVVGFPCCVYFANTWGPEFCPLPLPNGNGVSNIDMRCNRTNILFLPYKNDHSGTYTATINLLYTCTDR